MRMHMLHGLAHLHVYLLLPMAVVLDIAVVAMKDLLRQLTPFADSVLFLMTHYGGVR